MSAFSIRHIPKEIEKAIVHDAKKQGKTKTDIVIEALQQRYHLEPLAAKRQALHKFFGKMTAKEYEEFLHATHPFGEIDEEMWK